MSALHHRLGTVCVLHQRLGTVCVLHPEPATTQQRVPTRRASPPIQGTRRGGGAAGHPQIWRSKPASCSSLTSGSEPVSEYGLHSPSTSPVASHRTYLAQNPLTRRRGMAARRASVGGRRALLPGESMEQAMPETTSPITCARGGAGGVSD